MMRRVLSLRDVAALALCTVLSACANISGLGGSAEYGCKAPQGVQCNSVSGNYANALHNNLPTQRQRRQVDAIDGVAASRLPTISPIPPATTGTAAPAATDAAVALAASPLRSQARVLRLWFKPWEDADGDLYDQGFVYVQIDDGRWLIDHAQQRLRDAYAPIRPPRSSALPAPGSAKPVDPRLSGAGATDSRPGPPAMPFTSSPGAHEPDDTQ